MLLLLYTEVSENNSFNLVIFKILIFFFFTFCTSENIDVPIKTSLDKEFIAAYNDPQSEEYKALEREYTEKVSEYCWHSVAVLKSTLNILGVKRG